MHWRGILPKSSGHFPARMRRAGAIVFAVLALMSTSAALYADARGVVTFVAENAVRTRTQETQRLPRPNPQFSAVQGILRDSAGQSVGGAKIRLQMLPSGKVFETESTGDGVFRFTSVPAGNYGVTITKSGFRTVFRNDLRVSAAEVVTMEFTMDALTSPPMIQRPPQESGMQPAAPAQPVAPLPSYHQIQKPAVRSATPAPPLPPYDKVFQPEPDRWDVAMPQWKRYGHGGEYPYVRGHWWDPFNRNKWKGDYPIIRNSTFFDFTGTSDSVFDERRVPAPSGVSQARPGTAEFFGKGEQSFLNQNFRLSFDLFHGDTSFKPVDWRIQFTPEFNINYLDTQELGLVNVNVGAGTSRFDTHAGVQEAFVEYKMADLSPNYDFLSVRAGIQQFTSDFRGFLFSDEQPGLRLFGNLKSNRWQYNLAYFQMLEKDTNSELNTFQRRHQQVAVANLYMQDFIWKGYTTEFSVAYNKDDPTIHFDTNGFLVRPAPIGNVVNQGAGIETHGIRVAYLGWASDGHIGRLNVSHAFYQALGYDTFNPIAGRKVTINARMAALELSEDKDWARFRGSFFYASGDANPRDGRARGFDAIVDNPAFAGGDFSFWNREGIKLTGSGVFLTPQDSLLPSLRSNKTEGQANFVNPGLWLYNAGADFDLTPKLTAMTNFNFMRFDRTEPLELVLFQSPIHHNIGEEFDLGAKYRPLLTENIVLTFGGSVFQPGRGFQDIYTNRTLFSAFADLRFQF
ncbi:MAG: carboxypeptidase-like regulatory domain-containing protein [Candidatus Acidiferrales bacterium]